eukprot:TRINITY_DN26758_c0_g1_i1.p1 TRINITY_DN26758_c0_g1~~TRINITY_DN26758_c0_g1_i1.p1  ORF type:complete len:110 (+),score=29.12 TRINITY_DN26758_c0_g1_i1:206-535(+)
MAVFDDTEWSFVKGAFETVDRDYGWGIDDFHHNITDGHVVHHLFSTSIPHYNLSAATAALRVGLQKEPASSMLYHKRDSHWFFFEIFQFYSKHWFFLRKDKLHGTPKNM